MLSDKDKIRRLRFLLLKARLKIHNLQKEKSVNHNKQYIFAIIGFAYVKYLSDSFNNEINLAFCIIACLVLYLARRR